MGVWKESYINESSTNSVLTKQEKKTLKIIFNRTVVFGNNLCYSILTWFNRMQTTEHTDNIQWFRARAVTDEESNKHRSHRVNVSIQLWRRDNISALKLFRWKIEKNWMNGLLYPPTHKHTSFGHFHSFDGKSNLFLPRMKKKASN